MSFDKIDHPDNNDRIAILLMSLIIWMCIYLFWNLDNDDVIMQLHRPWGFAVTTSTSSTAGTRDHLITIWTNPLHRTNILNIFE